MEFRLPGVGGNSSFFVLTKEDGGWWPLELGITSATPKRCGGAEDEEFGSTMKVAAQFEIQLHIVPTREGEHRH